MPLYEYECRECTNRFEQLVFDSEIQITCRHCGSSNVNRLLSTFAVGSESPKAASRSESCAECPGMKGGTCPMNQ